MKPTVSQRSQSLALARFNFCLLLSLLVAAAAGQLANAAGPLSGGHEPQTTRSSFSRCQILASNTDDLLLDSTMRPADTETDSTRTNGLKLRTRGETPQSPGNQAFNIVSNIATLIIIVMVIGLVPTCGSAALCAIVYHAGNAIRGRRPSIG